jgi:prolyl-tRNA synthetase
MIHAEVYNDFLENVMAILRTSASSRRVSDFPGAINSMTAEGMMRDGKALQMATSHELGQNFARAFDIYFQNERVRPRCVTRRRGAHRRAGRRTHHGPRRRQRLVVPPQLAPTKRSSSPCATSRTSMTRASCGARPLGGGSARRGRPWARQLRSSVTDWEIKGVPLRIEVGPRDLAQGVVSVVRRDNGEKATISLESLRQHAVEMLDAMQQDMFAAALKFRDGATHEVKTVGEAMEAAQQGFAKLPWDAVGPDGEAELKTDAITVRCLQRADGSMPDADTEKNLVCIVAKSY